MVSELTTFSLANDFELSWKTLHTGRKIYRSQFPTNVFARTVRISAAANCWSTSSHSLVSSNSHAHFFDHLQAPSLSKHVLTSGVHAESFECVES